MNETISSNTYWVRIYIAGSYKSAIEICRKYCQEVSYCVNITNTTYVYNGGAEEGICVELIQYPKYLELETQIFKKANDLAERLRVGLYQRSFTIVSPEKTVYKSVGAVR